MYLTEIPESWASWLSSAVNVYGYQPMDCYILFFLLLYIVSPVGGDRWLLNVNIYYFK